MQRSTTVLSHKRFNYLLTNPCFLLLGVRESSISVGMQKIKFVYAHFILYKNLVYGSKQQGKITGSQKPEL